MKKIRIGIFGATRGLNFALGGLFGHPDAEATVICDACEPLQNRVKQELASKGIHPAFCAAFDEMLRIGIDAVIIANHANRHAEFAISALRHGIHVLSEVLPTQTPAEAVRLCEACEASGKIYRYAENYCFSDQTLEMRQRYRRGDIGELVSAECDFINDCSGRWNQITRGLRNHWRNHVPSTFYCTHSIGPMVYVCGLRPVTVVGMETPLLNYMREHGARSGSAATELLKMENGAFARSLNGNLKHPFLSRLRLIGTEGSMEHELGTLKVFREKFEPEEYRPRNRKIASLPGNEDAPLNRGTRAVLAGFIDGILGDAEALEAGIDVYQALDMSLPGIFAYRSILKGGAPMQLPDFRDPEQREPFRADNGCTDPEVAGDQLLPSCSSENAEIPDEVYAKEAALYEYGQEHNFHLGNY